MVEQKGYYKTKSKRVLQIKGLQKLLDVSKYILYYDIILTSLYYYFCSHGYLALLFMYDVPIVPIKHVSTIWLLFDGQSDYVFQSNFLPVYLSTYNRYTILYRCLWVWNNTSKIIIIWPRFRHVTGIRRKAIAI